MSDAAIALASRNDLSKRQACRGFAHPAARHSKFVNQGLLYLAAAWLDVPQYGRAQFLGLLGGHLAGRRCRYASNMPDLGRSDRMRFFGRSSRGLL
jgi:hypothetical protein